MRKGERNLSYTVQPHRNVFLTLSRPGRIQQDDPPEGTSLLDSDLFSPSSLLPPTLEDSEAAASAMSMRERWAREDEERYAREAVEADIREREREIQILQLELQMLPSMTVESQINRLASLRPRPIGVASPPPVLAQRDVPSSPAPGRKPSEPEPTSTPTPKTSQPESTPSRKPSETEPTSTLVPKTTEPAIVAGKPAEPEPTGKSAGNKPPKTLKDDISRTPSSPQPPVPVPPLPSKAAGQTTAAVDGGVPTPVKSPVIPQPTPLEMQAEAGAAVSRDVRAAEPAKPASAAERKASTDASNPVSPTAPDGVADKATGMEKAKTPTEQDSAAATDSTSMSAAGLEENSAEADAAATAVASVSGILRQSRPGPPVAARPRAGSVTTQSRMAVFEAQERETATQREQEAKQAALREQRARDRAKAEAEVRERAIAREAERVASALAAQREQEEAMAASRALVEKQRANELAALAAEDHTAVRRRESLDAACSTLEKQCALDLVAVQTTHAAARTKRDGELRLALAVTGLAASQARLIQERFDDDMRQTMFKLDQDRGRIQGACQDKLGALKRDYEVAEKGHAAKVAAMHAAFAEADAKRRYAASRPFQAWSMFT